MPNAPSPRDPACIFCRIVAGEIPCQQLHQDEQVLAFLDIGPLARGHCLVIPRAHYLKLEDVPAETVAACARLAARLGPAVCATVGAGAWNLLQNNGEVAGQVVPHVHFHVIPRQAGDGLGYRWPAGKLDAATAEQLRAAITRRLS